MATKTNGVRDHLSQRKQAMAICEAQAAAIAAAETARDNAVTAAQEVLAKAINDVRLVDAQLEALGYDKELEAPPRMPRGLGSQYPRPNAGTRGGGRGGRLGSLPNSILMVMNAFELGTEFRKADLVEGLPGVGWESSSDNDKNVGIQISNALKGLVEDKMIAKVSRGVYKLYAAGEKRAEAVAAEIEALDTVAAE